jgi:CRISPR-associated protein Csx3
MSHFPAIIIGGPPHSGKSVLSHSVHMELRRRGVVHYLYSASPDGEGRWSYESDQDLVRAIRVKGPYTEAFTTAVVDHLRGRSMPLLVDVGGMISPEQRLIFATATHFVAVTGYPGADQGYEANRAAWLAFAAEQGIELLADLRSVLEGENVLDPADGVIRGTVAGLRRSDDGSGNATGPAFEALVDRLEALLAGYGEEAAAAHRASTPHGTWLADIEQIAPALGVDPGDPQGWRPADLPALLNAVPKGLPLAVYGRGPVWLYTTLALHALPSVCYVYNTRDGWVALPALPTRPTATQTPTSSKPLFQATLIAGEAFDRLQMARSAQELSPARPEELALPPPGTAPGLVLEGSLPAWLYAAAARQMIPAYRWLGVFQPQLNGAAVVWSRDPARAVGSVLLTTAT